MVKGVLSTGPTPSSLSIPRSQKGLYPFNISLIIIHCTMENTFNKLTKWTTFDECEQKTKDNNYYLVNLKKVIYSLKVTRDTSLIYSFCRNHTGRR